MIALCESIMLTYQTTWDNCQQQLQVFFTTEEMEQILEATWKLVLGAKGLPTHLQADIDVIFPLAWPD